MTGPPPTPPPKWKTAIVTLIAVFPPVLFFNVTVIPYLGGVSVVVRTLALCIGVTAAVTWVMMPRLMPLVRNWLNASNGEPAEPGAEDPGVPRFRAARQRRAGEAEDGRNRTPAWLVDANPAERDLDPDPWYEAQRGAVPRRPARPAQGWDYGPPQQGSRRAPWYGRQQPWYGRPREDDYPTEEFRPDERRRPDEYRRKRYREDDYYEEPARYDRYDDPEWTPARDQGQGTGRYRR